jgi:hypothetical protein
MFMFMPLHKQASCLAWGGQFCIVKYYEISWNIVKFVLNFSQGKIHFLIFLHFNTSKKMAILSKVHKYLYVSGSVFSGTDLEVYNRISWNFEKKNIRVECEHRMPSGIRERHTELATLDCIRTQCNSEGKVAKYSWFFRPLWQLAQK